MTRICAHCGTEVDEEALFCPTCGEPIEPGAEPQLPPAPDWPELPARPIAASAPEPEPEPGPHAAFHEEEATPEPMASDPAVPEPVIVEAAAPEPPEAAEPTRPARPHEPEPDEPDEPEAPPPPFLASSRAADEAGQVTHGWEQPTSEATVPPWRRGVAHRAAEAPPVVPAGEAPPSQPAAVAPPPAALPRPAGMIQPPTLLSDWLIGGGALVATVAMFLPWRIGGSYTSGWGMASGVNVLYAIALLGVLAVVFLPHWLPLVPRRTLVLLAVGLVGVGIGLDRLGMALTGAGASIFLIAAVAMAAGGLVAELGHDRHLGGPQA